jgi:RNA polymerase sigma factor (sigma-70 family)
MSETHSAPSKSSEKGPNLSGELDYDLLEMMTWKESDPGVAREACAELYRRHAKYLYAVSFRFFKESGLGGEEAAEDLTSETFRRVLEHGAKTFKPGSATDPDGMRRHVRSWLGTIAHNLACDTLRGRVIEVPLEEDLARTMDDEERSEDRERSLRLTALMEKTLTKREIAVLLATSFYFDVRKPHQKLPDDVLEDLSRQWGITHENIRQIKRRALQKLEQAFSPVEMKVLDPVAKKPDRIPS